MQDLTFTQKIIYECIVKYISENGESPTVRELADLAGLSSTATVCDHLKKLERKGYIKRQDRKHRSIELREKDDGRIKYNSGNLVWYRGFYINLDD